MTLTNEVHKALARRLFEAEASDQPIPADAPDFARLSLEDAYAIQDEIAELKAAAGAVHIGWKTAGTNPAIRNRAGRGMTEPARGRLFQSALVESTAPLPPGFQIFVEPEISFVLAEDLEGPGATPAGVLAATKEICGSIEIAWTRFDRQPPAFALVADNAAASRLALSSRRFSIQEVGGLDALAQISVEFSRNGEVVQRGTGADVDGNPAHAVAWLANHLAAYGLGLKAGQIILAGSLTLPVLAQPGDVITARFEKLGDVEVRLTAT